MTIAGIFGNVAEDDYLNSEAIGKTKELLTQRGIDVNKSPKQVIDYDTFEYVLNEIKTNIILTKMGGGGYNSLKAFLYLANGDMNFIYHDLSKKPIEERNEPSEEKIDSLMIENPKVVYCFGNKSEICKSLILEEQIKRSIYKTERYDRNILLGKSDLEQIMNIIDKCDVVFINSLANYQVVETLGRYDEKPKYVVVTKNLSESQIRDSKIVGGSTAIIDIEESEVIGGSREKTPRNIEYVIEKLISLGAKNAIVTMDKEGVAFSNGDDEISTVFTNRDIEKKIQEHIKRCSIFKTETGDFFAAAIAYYLEMGKSLQDAITDSQIFVIKEKLRFENIDKKDFEVQYTKYIPYSMIY